MARVPRPLPVAAGQMQAASVIFGANRHASGPFQALIRISAWNVGDMRGWFQLILDTRAEADPPTCRQFSKKRLKGFEPTTFCMAIRPVSETSGQ